MPKSACSTETDAEVATDLAKKMRQYDRPTLAGIVLDSPDWPRVARVAALNEMVRRGTPKD